ncbi:hypothetical protein OEZ85_003756 [Tetradesmus obliquus]|uniref:J domain-containing protein n=1 Tax=Tetradesmus obliquus TaxID=3088 RepID=A0ABY8UCC4_TETOB|nr:hypothetical protein OEZ85_003756 [Tetradesmus obliquus]
MALFEEGTDPSYYAILNVPKDASYEDIKRAYRGLAQVFHPDKHLDDDLRDKAQEAFAKLQEAYEVLSDPQKRDVYDVYGKEGLNAGMSLGTKLKNTDELRKEWEAFKAQQRAAREEAAASHRGIYICRVDGRGWAHGDWAAVPQIRMVVVQNSLDVSVTDADVLLLQGQAALRGNQGSGSVVAGYKRVLSPNDELEAHAVLGLRSLLQLTSTRRLGHYTTAAATGSYSWDQGMGLQLTTSRQLTHSSSASLTWVVGPPNASSMGVSVSHRGSKYVITGKIDLGLVTSLSSRLTYLLNDNLSLKVTGRIGTSGVDAELGLARKFSPTSSLYAGSAVSLQGGTAFKVRYSRADALQYLVSGGKLELHGGVSKLGLMGFADVAEGDKELYVAYCYKQRLFEKVVGDADLLRLPGAGEPVCEPDVADRLWAKYRSMYQQQQQPQQPQEEAQ